MGVVEGDAIDEVVCAICGRAGTRIRAAKFGSLLHGVLFDILDLKFIFTLLSLTVVANNKPFIVPTIDFVKLKSS